MSDRPAFTLLEVLIAVTILSIAMSAMISMQSEAEYLMRKAQKKTEGVMLSSLAFYSTDASYDGKKVDGYTLAKPFDIDDRTRKILKSIQFKISYKLSPKDRRDLNISQLHFLRWDHRITIERYGTISSERLSQP